MIEPSTPILVGVGDVTDLTTPAEQGRAPYELIAQAARRAFDDAGAPGLAAIVDSVAMLRFFADTSHRFDTRLGRSSNPPRSVTRRLGIEPSEHLYTWNGGNMPQYLANLYAERIARGELRAALVFGGEALRTQHGVERAALDVSWAEDPGGSPQLIGDPRRGWNDVEDRHGMRAAISIYPLIENAIRGRRQHDVARHLRDMAALFERFAAVAAGNPLATRRDGFSAERLATVDADNRWIGFPYPRFMNSNAFIDQAAAFVMTSVEQATRLGIARDKWVFLHGCADAHDHWYVTERPDIAGSAAMRAGSELALEMAGKRVDELAFFDIYSCFPAAVEIAADRLGVAEDDPRGLTVTGGLPYFGGPGNNYVTHSICEMVRRVRGRSASFGLVTANGNYITKHSYGVYSTTPTLGRWQRQDPALLQDSLDALPRQPFVEHADGAAIIETYTVMHDRSGPVQGIVIGRLDATGARFIANTAADAATLTRLRDEEHLGRPGFVTAGSDGRNHFVAS